MPFLRALASAVSKFGRLNARKSKAADSTYNARRRFTRRAERLEKQAATESGAAAERLRIQAEDNYKKAMELFDSKEKQKEFAQKHGIEFTEKDTSAARREHLLQESVKRLESNLTDPTARRESEAREVLNSKVGSRIYAATRDIWIDYIDEEGKGHIDNRAMIERRIMDEFGVDSMAEVIDMFEKELGEKLYKDPDESARYDEVVSAAKVMMRRISRNG